MPNWIMYGLTSALFWGVYSNFSKIVTSDKFLKIQSDLSSLLMLAGISIVFLGYFLIKSQIGFNYKLIVAILLIVIVSIMLFIVSKSGVDISWKVILFGLGQGALWSLGMIFTFLAFSSGAEAAKLVPIYNTNTLIAVLIGMSFLHEVPSPDERLKIISGAVLIVLGGILVSK
ncbi:MAG TPA: hypothetical protein PK476_00275 [Candidatus Pacearchaeota archaeon]|nr:hypothetical protein [Candidatus Parcubacteria bacterium]HOC53422.1 hypothetical protein [Candidatus Pacearchaeota archaeon]HQM24330.1 hypothetical protein [Candidatus Pacearchaeota archaeon]